MRRGLWTFAGFAMGLIVATAYTASRHPFGETPVAADKLPLGISRQKLLDAIAANNKLEPVPGQPAGRYVVELNKSGATVAIDGPADTPHAVTLTSPFNNETAPVIATVARSLAKAILGEDTQYGEWAGKAIHKCEPGFAVSGEFQTNGPNPSTAEVKMQRTIVNGVEALVIRFRRTN